MSLQAQPEVLFEGTVSEGAPFKVKAAVVDSSGFAEFDDELLELEFRYLSGAPSSSVCMNHQV